LHSLYFEPLPAPTKGPVLTPMARTIRKPTDFKILVIHLPIPPPLPGLSLHLERPSPGGGVGPGLEVELVVAWLKALCTQLEDVAI
jgi:hypothetical protein